jgi:hypothetical protein
MIFMETWSLCIALVITTMKCSFWLFCWFQIREFFDTISLNVSMWTCNWHFTIWINLTYSHQNKHKQSENNWNKKECSLVHGLLYTFMQRGETFVRVNHNDNPKDRNFAAFVSLIAKPIFADTRATLTFERAAVHPCGCSRSLTVSVSYRILCYIDMRNIVDFKSESF